MRILAIETSCDETAVSIIEADGSFDNSHFKILGNTLLSQAEKHAEFGGVYPNLAKREHAKNLIPILEQTLKEAGLYSCAQTEPEVPPNNPVVEKILEREPELLKQFLRLFAVLEKPDIDAIAVTEGPGLEPALWVGINFAKALAVVWNIKLIPVNHMEGHVFSALLKKESGGEKFSIFNFQFPVLALLISGGHTELILMKDWLEYELVGATRDDAVGEAFDKVARMLDLPYPGGPEISKLSDLARSEKLPSEVRLPRPMLNRGDCDFSFSGLKTAVLYALKSLDTINEQTKKEFAREFEDAVVEILITKTKLATEKHDVKTLVLGGGVSANNSIRKAFQDFVKDRHQNVTLYIPSAELTTDNAIMIGIAGYFRLLNKEARLPDSVLAQGNLKLSL